MENPVRLYPRGFTFSTKQLGKLPENYKKINIIEKYFYAFDDNLEENTLIDDNKFIIIHGEFLHIGIDYQFTQPGLLKNLLDFYFNDYEKFLETLDYISGRYVIIIGNREDVMIFPDASNTRTTYFSLDENIISSHVYLIQDQFKHERNDYIFELPDLNNGLMNTPFENIKSMIPNHSFNFITKKVKRFFPRENNKFINYSEDEKFTLIERFWKEQLNFYFSKYENFIFSITGGGDSRFSLALLKEHLDKVQFFTYSRVKGEDNSSYAGKILTLDYKIVSQMLQDINLNHRFMYFVDDKKEISQTVKNILSRNTIGQHSSFLIPHVQENYPQENLKHIRGNLLEIGKTRYYSQTYRESNMKELKKVFDNQYNKSKKEDAIDYVEQSYNKFVKDLKYGEGTYDYHLLDLYHWEIRMGRWHPEILNTHDIVFDTLSPFNHRALIDISLSFPYEKRRNEYMFKEIINRNYPILNFYGDNDLSNLYEQIRDGNIEINIKGS